MVRVDQGPGIASRVATSSMVSAISFGTLTRSGVRSRTSRGSTVSSCSASTVRRSGPSART